MVYITAQLTKNNNENTLLTSVMFDLLFYQYSINHQEKHLLALLKVTPIFGLSYQNTHSKVLINVE